MQEIMIYVELIRKITALSYGKEVLFYENGEWYSRDHSRIISLEELSEYIFKIVEKEEWYE